MEKIPFFRPSIEEDEIEAVKEVIKSGHLTIGKKVEDFEQAFSDYIGHNHCVATNSLTNGYLILLDYLRPTFASMPSMTFVSMANIPKLLGIKVVFQDDIHVGHAYEITTDVGIIMDSAHDIRRGMCRGENGYWLFSFYANKGMSSLGEGGMLVCPDEKSYNHFMEARDCGIRHGKHSWDYIVERPGWYAYMTDPSAAFGLVQLRKLDEMNRKKQELVNRYNEKLGESNTSLHLYTISVDKRDDFIRYMEENGVETSVHFRPIHMQPAFDNGMRLPETERVAKRIVSLPLYPDLKKCEVNLICDLVDDWRQP